MFAGGTALPERGPDLRQPLRVDYDTDRVTRLDTGLRERYGHLAVCAPVSADVDLARRFSLDDTLPDDRSTPRNGDTRHREVLGELRHHLERPPEQRGLRPGRAEALGVNNLVADVAVTVVQRVADVLVHPENGPTAVCVADDTRREVRVEVTGQAGDGVGIRDTGRSERLRCAAVTLDGGERLVACTLDALAVAVDDGNVVSLVAGCARGPPSDAAVSDSYTSYGLLRQPAENSPGRTGRRLLSGTLSPVPDTDRTTAGYCSSTGSSGS